MAYGATIESIGNLLQ